jgi:uncharacterized protein YcnI
VRNRVLLAGGAALLASVALTGTASAHVTIIGTGEQGGFSVVTFSVPNERDDAGTVSLEVQMPQEAPLAFVSVQPKPGWTVETTTRTLDEPADAFGEQLTEVVDTVTWSGGTIEPGQFDTFSISVGPLPDDVDRLEFPAIQIYSSGEEVAWIEPTPQGGEEPENPAPVLELVAPTGSGTESEGSADTATTVASATDEQAAADTDTESEDDNDTLVIVTLIIAIIGVALGGAAFIAARGRPTT